MLIASIYKLEDYSPKLKDLGANALELRLDLMSEQDLKKLHTLINPFNLPLILTLKPAFKKIDLFHSLCLHLHPSYIDVDYTLFNINVKKLKTLDPSCTLLVSKHTKQIYELEKFFQKYPEAHLHKLVIETENTELGLKIALQAQKKNQICFASGQNTAFTRFFSAWHYCCISKPTGIGQYTLETLSTLYATHFEVKSFLALIGNPVNQSPSDVTHNALLKNLGEKHIYLKMCLNKRHLFSSLRCLRSLGCLGLSITTPFKAAIPLRYLHTHRREKIINTLDFKRNRVANTDNKALQDLISTFDNPKILILGSGAVSEGFIDLFKTLGLKHSIWSRRNPIELHTHYDVIINATSSENPLSRLPQCHLLINLFHTKISPQIEKIALTQNAQVITGQTFFYLQAIEQFKFWFENFKPILLSEFFSLVKRPRDG